ncbi:hypothetical protein [Corynebacterium variabile]|uniref:hypothetical protein n=1 Tax=Corynebacterium variabile TaxID=1727 RepID=UPI003FD5E180
MSNRKQRRDKNRRNRNAAQQWFDNIARDLAPDEVSYVMGNTYYRVSDVPEEEASRIKSGAYKSRGAALLAVKMAQNGSAFPLRPDASSILYEEARAGRLTPEQLRHMLLTVWSLAVKPGTILPREHWTWIYRRAGYVDWVDYLKPPPATIHLYRGATPEAQGNHAWTASRVMAEAFARRNPGNGRVYETTAHVENLLAHYPASDIGDEWIVDTEGLTITEANPKFTTKLVYQGIAPSHLAHLVKKSGWSPSVPATTGEHP